MVEKIATRQLVYDLKNANLDDYHNLLAAINWDTCCVVEDVKVMCKDILLSRRSGHSKDSAQRVRMDH